MIIITSFFFTVFHLSGQEVDYNKKNNEVRIDGVYSFKIIKHGCGFEPDCYFDIYDKDEVKVLKIVYKSFKSPVEISQSNPEGIVRYSQFIFLETEKIAEMINDFNSITFTSKIIMNSDRFEFAMTFV